MQLDTSYKIYYFLTTLLLVVIFCVDINTPLGFAGGSVYIFPIFIISRIPGTKAILVTGIIAIILTILGYYLSPVMHAGVNFTPPTQTNLLPISMVNRIFSLGVISLSTFFAIKNNMKQQALFEQAKFLRKQNVILKTYASIAAHDLQEPLRKIQTFISFLDDDHGHKLDDDGRHLISIIQKASQRLRNLVRDMLEYAQLENVSEKQSSVDLEKVLFSVTKDLSLQINEKKAQINISPLPSIYGNEIEIRRLFQNLLSNALKYAEPKRPLKVSIRNDVEEKNHIIIYFEDNGIGFHPIFSNQIFLPLKRLKMKKGIEGSGIGLAQCKKIMKNMGGNIFAESKPNEGAVFTLRFPLNKAR